MKAHHISAFLLALMTLASCDPVQTESEAAMDESDLTAREALWQQYRSEARRSGDAWLVEGDRFFASEAELRAHFDREYARTFAPSGADDELVSKLAIWSYNGVEPRFEGGAAVDIKYCVDEGVSSYSTVVSRMRSATAAWEAIANINFVHVSGEDDDCDPSNTDVDFAVIQLGVPIYHEVDYYVGCATSRLPGSSSCQLEDGWSVDGVLAFRPELIDAPETMTGLFRHELGHILGFGHEHPWSSDSCRYLEGTDGKRRLTEYDPDSVMHYRASCDINSDFTISELDGFGARRIYGLPMPWHVATQISLL